MSSINLYFGTANQDNYEFIVKLAKQEYDGNLSRAVNAIISKHRNGGGTIEQRLDEILFTVRNLQVVKVGKAEEIEEEIVSGIGEEFFR